MTAFVNPLARNARPGYRQATAVLKSETRQLLGLGDDVTVSITELACRDAGCPDIETVVGVLVAGAPPRIGKVHKPLPDVTVADLAEAFAKT